MKRLDRPEIDRWRVLDHPGGRGDETCGAFVIKLGGMRLRVIASNDAGWDHVSISAINRVPTWEEMELVKRLFFEDHETAMQLHVPPAEHINRNSNVLHLWRPHDTPIPRPPSIFV